MALRIGLNEWASASHGSSLATHRALGGVVICRAAVVTECTNRTGPDLDPFVATSPGRFCNRHVWAKMLDVGASEGGPSSYHRDVGFVIFSETQVSDSVDVKNGRPERRCQPRLCHGEAGSHDEGKMRDGEEASERDSCLRVESVGVAQGSADGMCLSIYHPFGLGLDLARDPCPFRNRKWCARPIADIRYG